MGASVYFVAPALYDEVAELIGLHFLFYACRMVGGCISAHHGLWCGVHCARIDLDRFIPIHVIAGVSTGYLFG